MDEKDETTPFAREPWRRLLADDREGPPEITDARVRAAARRDLAPRGRRWWLPASLAASFVLAIFVVESQLGSLRIPVASESRDGAGGAIEARIIDREESREARQPGASPSAPDARAAKARAPAEADDYGYQEPELAADSGGAGPLVGGPERELKEASQPPQESAASTTEMTSDLPAAPPPQAAAAAQPSEYDAEPTGAREREDERVAQLPPATTKIRPPPFERTPETWYAFIEKLRAQGRIEEADRQLERLEKAHPGWLARHLKDNPER